MSEEQIEDSGSETAEDSGEVSITQLTDEELSNHLDEAPEKVGESDGEPTIPVESPEEQSTYVIEEPTKAPAQEEPKEQEVKDAPEQPQQPTQEELQAQIEKQNQQLAQLNHFAQRQRSEIATLKKQREDYIAKLSQGLDEKHVTDPNGWLRDQQEIQKAQDEIESLEEHDQGIQARLQTQQTIATYLTPEEANIENMVQCLSRDPKVSRDYIEQVRRDPMGAMGGDSFIHLAKRAQAEKAVVGFYSMYNEAKSEVEKLKAEIETLKSKPSNMLRRINEVTKSKPTITSKNGSASTSKTPAINITDLSDAELEEALARAN